MPNGGPGCGGMPPAEMEAFFAPFAAACWRFAERHNIRIEALNTG
jgi:hypothetical protein